MTSLQEVRNTTQEIAQILERLTPEQKLRAKDILVGISLISLEPQKASKKNKPS